MRSFLFTRGLVCVLILFVTAEQRPENAAMSVEEVTEESGIKEDLTTEEEADRGPVRGIVNVAGQVMTTGADDYMGIVDHTTDSTTGKKDVVLKLDDTLLYWALILIPIILTLFGIASVLSQLRLVESMNSVRRTLLESNELSEIAPTPRPDAGVGNRDSDTDGGNDNSMSKGNPNSEEIEDSEANGKTDQTSLKETRKPGPDGKAGATIVSVTSQTNGEADENITNGDEEDTTSINSGNVCQVDTSKLEKLDESKEGAASAGSCIVDTVLKKADTFSLAMENGHKSRSGLEKKVMESRGEAGPLSSSSTSPKKVPDSSTSASGFKMVK